MKQLFIVGLLCWACSRGMAQTTGMTDSAYRVAKKMKDTLSLSDNQLQNLFGINMQLQLQKLMKQQTGGNGNQLQAIENTRDSLYHTILSDSSFTLYKQKKERLLSVN